MASAEAYRALVERLEREAREAPAWYRTRLALLASLGFVVLGGAVVLAFGLSVGLVLVLFAISPILLLKLVKLVWIPVAIGWMILRALWVRIPRPEGHLLADGEAPLLRAEVERLRGETGAPALAGIVIDADLNAAAASVPRALGLLGHRHYLVLGLPLMRMLDPAQFASVVAHEFGHFGGGHGRFTGWIYRVRASWYRLLEALSGQHSWIGTVFVKFFDWYAPYFNAYSFVLARANEYQADAAAARAVGAQVAGDALIRSDLGATRLERAFWPDVNAACRREPSPPAKLYSDMAMVLREGGPDDQAHLDAAMARGGGLHDSHPSLAQRLSALGAAAVLVSPPDVTAADALLGDFAGTLEQRFSDTWRDDVADAWEANHRQHADDVARLAVLEAQPARVGDEAVEFARLCESLRPEQDALARYLEVLADQPENAFARFRAGALLLEREDASGAGHLWEAIRFDPEGAPTVLPYLHHHYDARDDHAGLARVESAWQEFRKAQSGADRARATLSSGDTYLPHGLDADTVAAVGALLAREGGISAAWLARKRLPEGAGSVPHFVLLVKWRGIVLSEEGKLQRIADGLALPGSVMVISPASDRGAARKLRKAAGAPLFRKPWW